MNIIKTSFIKENKESFNFLYKIFFKSGLKYFILMSLFLSAYSEARIRTRKVKEAPRACTLMSEDKLLSRPDKKVLSTERHSLVFEDTETSLTLVKDKGEKICEWNLADLNAIAPVENFKFYIDEYKEMIYPYTQLNDGSMLVIKSPLSECSLNNKLTQMKFEFPKCEKPKKSASKKHKKNKRLTKDT